MCKSDRERDRERKRVRERVPNRERERKIERACEVITRKKKESQRKEKIKSDGAGERER